MGFVQRGEQEALDVVAFAQLLEQLIGDLLRAAAHQFGMELADQKNPERHGAVTEGDGWTGAPAATPVPAR
jgi:hypothetical protein